MIDLLLPSHPSHLLQRLAAACEPKQFDIGTMPRQTGIRSRPFGFNSRPLSRANESKLMNNRPPICGHQSLLYRGRRSLVASFAEMLYQLAKEMKATNSMAHDGQVHLNELYSNGQYLKKHPTWHSEAAQWKASHVVLGLQKTKLKPATICDIGCGTGTALMSIVDLLGGVQRAVGFEPSPDAPFDTCSDERIELRREHANQAETKFDLGIMLDVFEHVEDYYSFLRSCSKIADYFAFHIPLDISIKSMLQSGITSSHRSVGHLHYFTRETALQVLNDTGYEVLHWHYTKSAWDRPGRKAWTLINLVRRPCFALAPTWTQRVLGGVSLLVVAKTRESNH